MENSIELNVEISLDENIIYFSEDNCSGSKYKFKNIEDVISAFEQYIRIYHICEIKQNDNCDNLFRNFKLSNGNYLKVEKSSDGYEFSYYDKDKKLIDGGIIEDLNPFNIKEILKILSINPDNVDVKLINEDIVENIN